MKLIARELREAFDASFAEAPVEPEVGGHAVLLVRARGRSVALRADELAGVSRCPRITAAPTTEVALLGLTALGGELVAAFDLAALLGEEGHEAGAGAARWMARCAADPTVGLVFDAVEGRFVAARSDLVGVGAATSVRAIVRTPAGDRPLIDAGAILDRLAASAGGKR